MKHWTSPQQEQAIVTALKKQLEEIQQERIICSMQGDTNGVRACRKLERATRVALEKFTKVPTKEEDSVGTGGE